MSLNFSRRRIDLGLAVGALSVLGLAGCQMPGPAGPPRLVKHFEWGSMEEMADLGGNLIFVASDGAHGTELWRSDGTPQGTVLLKDTWPGVGPAPETVCRHCRVEPTSLTRIGRRLFFVTGDGSYGREPWVTDGTEAGTRMAEDVNPGGESSLDSYASFVDLQGTALFAAYEPGFGHELWRTDGTERGTVLLADIASGPASSSLYDFVHQQRSGLDYFTAEDRVGWALWRTDGTPRGTAPVVRLPDYSEVVADAGKVLLLVLDPEVGGELWASDGTAEGTRLLKDICPGPCHSNPGSFLRLGEAVLFHADDGQHGWELWRSDGTPEGTMMLRDIYPGTIGGFPYSFVRVGSLAYFVAYSGPSGRSSLWMTDGTGAGTQMVPGTEEKDVLTPTASGHRLFFATCTYPAGCDLWALDIN